MFFFTSLLVDKDILLFLNLSVLIGKIFLCNNFFTDFEALPQYSWWAESFMKPQQASWLLAEVVCYWRYFSVSEDWNPPYLCVRSDAYGRGYPFSASSMTNIQSISSPGWGEIKSCCPWLANFPILVDVPVRGLYHQPRNLLLLMTDVFTLNFRPTGA